MAPGEPRGPSCVFIGVCLYIFFFNVFIKLTYAPGANDHSPNYSKDSR